MDLSTVVGLFSARLVLTSSSSSSSGPHLRWANCMWRTSRTSILELDFLESEILQYSCTCLHPRFLFSFRLREEASKANAGALACVPDRMASADGEVGGSLPGARIARDTVRESGWWSSSVGAAVFALLVGLVWLNFVEARRRRKLLPPGPRPWPIVGNFPALARALPYRYLQKLAFKYGELMYLRLGM